jgi:hypothetical protein
MRTLLTLFWFAAAAGSALAQTTQESDAPCRSDYVVPYTEQCEFDYKNLKSNPSPRDLSLAFDACARAQDASVSCVKSSDHDVHVVALSALYRAVVLQAEIAMYSRQFRVAEALLRERLNVIDIVEREARPGDTAPAEERSAARRELGESQAGECTERALASAGRQFSLAKAHKYGDLATLLKKKYDDYAECARLVPDPADRAYVRYVGLVALEESGRAAQAAGKKSAADDAYRSCAEGAERIAHDASTRVKGYLVTVGALCKGRMDGSYAVDRPVPIDAQDGKSFQPLTLPKP